MYRAGVILSGCGKKDGTDITEAVMLFLALDRAGVETVCMSIDKDQFEVVNHLEDSTQMSGQKRNMLIESARLARGGIVDLDGVENVDFDILIIPGGKGVLKNLSTFMSEELEFRVNSSVQRIIADSNRSGKPIGAMCGAVVLLAKSLENIANNLKITATGQPEEGRIAIERTGFNHRDCQEGEVCTDEENMIVTSPALSPDVDLEVVRTTAESMVQALLTLLRKKGGSPLN
ncbi:MAG: isoprenoid biosynthesis glyoxalase ElbB [Mesotoga sp.]|jgi:enhancing lycopene biosynthesis protein 2|nr:isoprenoid biosynthesis glyoxalase ElbB [Mesotoga sp.]